MGYIRNIWCLILLFVSSFALGQSIDDLTTQYHSLSGRYSLKSVSQLTDSTYLVTGQFIDYRPITNPFTVDSISTGMYVWSNNCEKWLIDSIGAKSGTTIQLKIKGSTLNSPPNLNHGAILDYQYGWPPIPVGIAAHLETCIWDDFMYLLNDDIDNIVAGVSTVDSTTISNDSIFLWSKGTPYFTGITPDGVPDPIDSTFIRNDSIFIANGVNEYFSGIPPSAIPTPIDSTFIRNDSVFIASNSQEFYVGPATSDSGGGLSTQEGATAPYGLVTPTGRGAVYVDTVLQKSYVANGTTNVDWSYQVGKYIEVDSLDQILDGTYPDGTLITVKGTNGTSPSKYVVQSSWAYDVDTLTVIPVSGGFAIYQPEGGKINLGSLTKGSDLIDDTDAIRKAGVHLQWSKASILFVPKGDWYINENLSNYNPRINIYGSLEGASRDSSIIRVDSITGTPTGENKILRMLRSGSRVFGLGFDINGDPNLTGGVGDQVTLLDLAANNITVEWCHFRRFVLGSSNTAGNTYVSSFIGQNGFEYNTTTADTLFPGTSVGVTLTGSAENFVARSPVIIYDATTGNSDTTWVINRFLDPDSLLLGVITDTIPAGAEIKTPTFGHNETVVRHSILENMHKGCALRLVAQKVLIQGNFFKNNGTNTTHHDNYNQSGFQTIVDNWFEGGSGYGISDGNKQEYRFSGGRLISGNTFWNKALCIQLVTQSNPVTHYASGLPVSFYGNRVQNGGEVITDNTFHNTPGLPQISAFQVGAAFGGIDPNSVLLGNASLVYANNTHIGRVQFAASSDYLDLIFEGNLFELNDTSNILTNPASQVSISFPDSARVVNNQFIARGPDHFQLSGSKLDVENLRFHQALITALSENNLRFTDTRMVDSEITIDSVLNVAQTQHVQMFYPDGGSYERNVFSYTGSSRALPLGMVVNGADVPNFIDNKWNNSGITIPTGSGHNNLFKGSIIRDNTGMRIWSTGQIAYPFGATEQTEGSGTLLFTKTNTLTGTGPQGGDLIDIGSDSTYTIATHLTEDIDGVLMMGSRFDSIIAYSGLYEGQILRINTTGAAFVNDYLVIDTLVAGKLKSQGTARPTGQNLIVRALERASVWDSGTTYEIGDIVEYNDRNYVCSYPNTNQTPFTSQFTVNNYWNGRPLKVQVVKHGIDIVNFPDTSLYFQNTNYTLTAQQVEDFDLISFTSRVNSSSTEDNTITLPDPADSLVNTRIVVYSDDLDNGTEDSYDTEVLAHNLYKGNQSIVDSSYVLAGGETIELICVPRASGYVWELVSTWDGWTSSASRSNTSATILTERKFYYEFINTLSSRDTFDVSDLEAGDRIKIEVLNTEDTITKALYLSSGQFDWENTLTDSLFFNYGDQHLELLWNGTNMRVIGNKNIYKSLTLSTEVASTTTAVVGQITLVNTTGGGVTINPPASPVKGDTFAVSDSRGNGLSGNITVDFVTAGVNFNGSSNNAVINSDRGYLEFVYVDSTVGWILK